MDEATSVVDWEATPKLNKPLMVVAFEGMFDAGDCATGAVEAIKEQGDCVCIATIDADEFYDFQETRPRISFSNAMSRIEWPAVVAHAVTGNPKHDLVMITGIEPRMAWRTFCGALLEIAEQTKCEMVITLGASASNVPHSRPALVHGSAGNPQLATKLGLSRPTYQGPTGIIGTFHDSADKADVPVISLRVQVPHYVAGPSNPKGIRALLAEFEWITGVSTDPQQLDADVDEWEKRVSEAVADDPDVSMYIDRLEQVADREINQRLPSADEIAAQVEAFLGDRAQTADQTDDKASGQPDADQTADQPDADQTADQPDDDDQPDAAR